jgi:hypothetical protein
LPVQKILAMYGIKIATALLLITGAIACTNSAKNTGAATAAGSRVLATAYGETLYANDLAPLINDSMPPEDSARAVNGAVQKWLRDRVMLHTVADKVKSSPEIEQLVENYRNSLLLQRYREELAADKSPKTDTAVAEADLHAAFDSLKTTFVNNVTQVNCTFVAIPARWKDLPQFEKLWADAKNDAALSDFCKKNAEEFIVNKWLSYDDLAAKLPKGALPESSLAANKKFTVKKADTYYYIRINEAQKKGETATYAAAHDRLKAIVLQQRTSSLWDKAVNAGYQAALKAGHIEIK